MGGPTFNEFVTWVFYSLMSGSSIYLVSILSGLKTSVQELNIKMATIVERVSFHEKRIEKIEEKIQ